MNVLVFITAVIGLLAYFLVGAVTVHTLQDKNNEQYGGVFYASVLILWPLMYALGALALTVAFILGNFERLVVYIRGDK